MRILLLLITAGALTASAGEPGIDAARRYIQYLHAVDGRAPAIGVRTVPMFGPAALPLLDADLTAAIARDRDLPLYYGNLATVLGEIASKDGLPLLARIPDEMARQPSVARAIRRARAIIARPDQRAGGGLTVRLQAPAAIAAGQPIPLTLTFANTGQQPVQVAHRERIPAAIAYAFTVMSDKGQLVRSQPREDLRGHRPADNVTLAPGRTVAFNLARFGDYYRLTPGRYRIRADLSWVDGLAGSNIIELAVTE